MAMNYIHIYSTEDDNEISILENIFKDEGVKYEIHTGPTGSTSKPLQKKVLVAEEDKEKAKELLDQTGLPVARHHSRTRRIASNKLILIFLALLILVVIALLITWFMNPE